MEGIVWVWGENQNEKPPAGPPSVSVSLWPHLFDQQWQRWDVTQQPTEAAKHARVAFVNLFHTEDSVHIQQIKSYNPACTVIAMPDAPIDLILNTPAYAVPMLRQMALADYIGGRTSTDCEVYGTLINKPTVYLPSPIGPTDWFVPYRSLPKDDYVLTLDHQFAPENTVCNVAVLAALQRETGCRVKYVGARDHTRKYADLAGLEAEWIDHLPFPKFVEMTARARLCVDTYAAHSYGRQQVLCGMVGTPCVGSDWCARPYFPSVKIDPFDMRDMVVASKNYYTNDAYYKWFKAESINTVDNQFGFEASRNRIADFMSIIQ